MPYKSQSLVLLFILSSFSAFSQKTPLAFKDFTPKWSHYFMSEDLSDTIQYYFSPEFPVDKMGKLIEQDNALYIVNNINHKLGTQGYLVEKIDVNTGDEIWEHYAYQDELYTREFAKNPFIKDGTLNIIIYKEIEPGTFDQAWYKCHAGMRRIDLQTGVRIDSFGTDKNDDDNKALLISWDFFHTTPEISSSRLYSDNEGGYKYIHHIMNKIDGINYFSYDMYDLDENGHVTNEKSYTKWIGKDPHGLKTIELGNDMFLGSYTIDTTDSLGITTKQPKYEVLDRELNIIHEGDVRVSNANMEGYITAKLEDINDSLQYFNFYHHNYDNETIDSMHLETIPYRWYWSIILRSGNMLICIETKENENNAFTYYASNGNGTTRLLKKLVVDDPTQKVSLDGIQEMENGDILTRFTQVDRNSTINPVPNWVNYVMQSAESLGLETSVKDISKEEIKVEIYPNPTSETLHFDTDEVMKLSKIRILDNQSRIIKTVIFQSEISINELNNGIYFLEFLNKENRSIGIKKIIKM